MASIYCTRVLICLGVSTATIACGGAPSGPTNPPLTITTVTITGPSTLTEVAPQGQLTATVTYSNGVTQDQTRAATWTSSRPDLVAVTATGFVTGFGSGVSDITATFQGVIGRRTIGVSFLCELHHTAAVKFQNNSPDLTLTSFWNNASVFTLGPNSTSQAVDVPAGVPQVYGFRIANTIQVACHDLSIAFAQCSTQTIACP